MHRDPLLRAWGWLIALSLASTTITFWTWPPPLTSFAGILILLLAWAKARIILARYLGLACAPFWRRGFDIALGVFCLMCLGLYIVP